VLPAQVFDFLIAKLDSRRKNETREQQRSLVGQKTNVC
jgi:hypothetical protein